MAVLAIREGAHDFIEKSFDTECLTRVVQQALEKRALLLETRRLRERLDEHARCRSSASRLVWSRCTG